MPVGPVAVTLVAFICVIGGATGFYLVEEFARRRGRDGRR